MLGMYTTIPILPNVLNMFMAGWGGIFAVMLMRKLGRLPVLFWSQVLALGFLVGCTFAPNLKTFTGKPSHGVNYKIRLIVICLVAMRCLTAFFAYVDPVIFGSYTDTRYLP